nr:MAG: hypothetical protein [Tombusviridae sp.]
MDTISIVPYVAPEEESGIGGVEIIFDLEKTRRGLDSILRVDARDLEIIEENPFVSITVFCQKWFQKAFGLGKKESTEIEVLKQVVTSAMEEAHEDPVDYVETHIDTSTRTTYNNGEAVVEVTRQRKTQRLVKGNRSKFAASLAQLVKVKFGSLKYTEANRLMVHRWLSKFVDETYADLRTVDKVLALERATFMSFIVSEDFARFQVLFESEAMKDRLLAHFGQD